jgi:hypothetical protein
MFSMTSAAIFTLWAEELASIFRRRFAMCFACLIKPSSARESHLVEADCDPELLLVALGWMNSRLTSSDSKSCRHSGHMSSINLSTHEKQYVCPKRRGECHPINDRLSPGLTTRKRADVFEFE